MADQSTLTHEMSSLLDAKLVDSHLKLEDIQETMVKRVCAKLEEITAIQQEHTLKLEKLNELLDHPFLRPGQLA